MTYINAMVAAVPDDKRQEFIDHAREFAGLFKEFGATRVIDTWADEVPDGELTSFPLAVKKEDGESVVVSFIEWPSKQVMDDAWARLMQDERMHAMQMPFDGKRLIHGSFEVVVEE